VRDNLRGLFAKVEDFNNELLDIYGGKNTKNGAIVLLRGWVNRIKFPVDGDSGLYSEGFRDTESLQERLNEFRDLGFWPVMTDLTIFPDSPLLRRGFVLVDLPAYHNNYARGWIARKAATECDDMTVVCHIKRARTRTFYETSLKSRLSASKAAI
jgi:hypothetical protein